MTTQNYTQTDALLLELCKDYMRINNMTPVEFSNELMDLASQSCDIAASQFKDAFESLSEPS